jgi:hypothetical protein
MVVSDYRINHQLWFLTGWCVSGGAGKIGLGGVFYNKQQRAKT